MFKSEIEYSMCLVMSETSDCETLVNEEMSISENYDRMLCIVFVCV